MAMSMGIAPCLQFRPSNGTKMEFGGGGGRHMNVFGAHGGVAVDQLLWRVQLRKAVRMMKGSCATCTASTWPLSAAQCMAVPTRRYVFAHSQNMNGQLRVGCDAYGHPEACGSTRRRGRR
jgi:hypothetical protein